MRCVHIVVLDIFVPVHILSAHECVVVFKDVKCLLARKRVRVCICTFNVRAHKRTMLELKKYRIFFLE